MIILLFFYYILEYPINNYYDNVQLLKNICEDAFPDKA